MMIEGRIGDTWIKPFPGPNDTCEERAVCTVTLEFDVLPGSAVPILNALIHAAHEQLTRTTTKEPF